MNEISRITSLSVAQSSQPLNSILDVLCPMHLRLSKSGHITYVGPTLQKLRREGTLIGRRFLEVFSLDRPRSVETMQALMRTARTKLHLKFFDPPCSELKGVLVHLPDGQGAIVNLSFGIYVAESVADYDLTSSDFAATDLATEMLYLVEAKTAAMDASRKLNERLQGAKLAAEEQALTDTLTGLRNRRAADLELGRLAALDHGFALMHIDLDFFKAVNDTRGHAAGDHVLQVVARILQSEVRQTDVVARVGGDEFIVLFDNLINPRRLMDISHRVIKGLERPIPFENDVCSISASIGIAISETDTLPDPDEIMQHSDVALYASKRRGRRCATIYDASLCRRNNDAS